MMATRDGSAFIREQIVSLRGQTFPYIDLWVSDDGSTDGTPDIVASLRDSWHKGSLTIASGPQQGFAENFRSMIVNPRIEADYYAFCDQDDIWEANKLDAAVEWMRAFDPAVPLLFCSRTTTISEDGVAIGYSPLFDEAPSFRNALVQSLAGGNTMVINKTARDLIAKASARVSFVSHDWWAYLLVTGAGGVVHYEPTPLVRYRQHGANHVGANVSWRARLSRLRRLFKGQFADWTDSNLRGLAMNREILTKDALSVLSLFLRSRRGGILRRLRYLHRAGVYRQTMLGTMGLYLAYISRRI